MLLLMFGMRRVDESILTPRTSDFPRYRAILYERNYYDIFFLDTAGNCIYSVYKEPSSCLEPP